MVLTSKVRLLQSPVISSLEATHRLFLIEYRWRTTPTPLALVNCSLVSRPLARLQAIARVQLARMARLWSKLSLLSRPSTSLGTSLTQKGFQTRRARPIAPLVVSTAVWPQATLYKNSQTPRLRLGTCKAFQGRGKCMLNKWTGCKETRSLSTCPRPSLARTTPSKTYRA